MGSIVTSIGKAIKGIGKALKKIAPILLMVAAIYIGYGYMTGFQSGGWPQIMNWGKSLISGVTQGETISAATAAADVGAVEATAAPALAATEATAISPTDVTTTALTAAGAEGAPLAGEVAEVGQAVNWKDTIDGLISQNDAISNTWTNNLSDFNSGFQNVLNSLNPMSEAKAGLPMGSLFNRGGGDIAGIEVGADQAALYQGTDGAGFPGGEGGTFPGVSPNAGYVSRADLESAANIIPHTADKSFPARLAELGKKAWNIYKNMWADNPGMAMWTTANVLKTIFALLDDSAEKESYARRHVMGFAPGGFDDMPAKYGGKSGRGGGVTTASRRPSSGLKVGRLPEATASRTSAIDRRPPGIIGSTPQRTV